MNLKKIFKPNLKNIILAILLTIILVPFITHDNGVRCITVPCDSIDTSSIVSYLLSDKLPIYSLNFIYLIIGISISYIISCTAFYFFKDKVFGK